MPVRFEGQSCSQAGQDIVVRWLLGDGPGKFYFEIGAGHPFSLSNSALLEWCGWDGVSIDSDQARVREWSGQRKNPCLWADATTADLLAALNGRRRVDYLSIDIDDFSLVALDRFPWAECSVGFITFEHNRYARGGTLAEPAFALLTGLGFERVCKDVGVCSEIHNPMAFEDWYASPEVAASAVAIRSDGEPWPEIVKRIGQPPILAC